MIKDQIDCFVFYIDRHDLGNTLFVIQGAEQGVALDDLGIGDVATLEEHLLSTLELSVLGNHGNEEALSRGKD